LNQFPSDFPQIVGKNIIYLLATKSPFSLEGSEWEKIFASSISGEWKPSSVGLDDIVKGNCAWSAKSVKNPKPFTAKTVRLISGRNSPGYSFQGITELSDNGKGSQVLSIWNKRVDLIRERYAHSRTVILLKGQDLKQYSVFEIETLRFSQDLFKWSTNKNGNLEGYEIVNGKHRFTWQPHGSQFTIIEDIPAHRLKFKVRIPPEPNMEHILRSVKFDPSWIQIIE
jgi:hypothetical protein